MYRGTLHWMRRLFLFAACLAERCYMTEPMCDGLHGGLLYINCVQVPLVPSNDILVCPMISDFLCAEYVTPVFIIIRVFFVRIKELPALSYVYKISFPES